MSVRRVSRVLGALALALLSAFAVPGPASAARVDLPDVGVSVAFDHSSYNGAVPFILLFTFTNTGAATAHNVRVQGGDVEGITLDSQELDHFDLAPGAVHTATLTGMITADGVRNGTLSYSVGFESDEADANPANNSAFAFTHTLGAFGDLHGVVFDDAGPPPPDQHGVACVTVIVTTHFEPVVEVARLSTDAAGAFRLAHLPAGDYLLTLVLPTGYKLKFDDESSLTTQVRSDLTGPSIPLIRTDGAVHCPPGTPTGGAAAPVLPATGAAARRIGAAGVGALIVGVALVLVARRRRRTT